MVGPVLSLADHLGRLRVDGDRNLRPAGAALAADGPGDKIGHRVVSAEPGLKRQPGGAHANGKSLPSVPSAS